MLNKGKSKNSIKENTQHFAIVGPTASGKTELSIKIAERLGLEIVSCDSVSVYKNLDIGSSKPRKEEQARVKHHLIDIVDYWKDYNVSMYEQDAGKILDKENDKGQIVQKLIVGGTGFYLEALINGMFNAPPVNKEITKKLEIRLAKKGINVLTEELKIIDPETFARIAKNDKYRIIRALELYLNTGKTMSYYRLLHSKTPVKRNIKIFAINEDRKLLKKRIQKRTNKMFDEGIVEEVESLIRNIPAKMEIKNIKSLKTVGYKEVVDLINGNINKEDAIYLINKNTYKLAKRQMTWFRRMQNTEFMSREEIFKLLTNIKYD